MKAWHDGRKSWQVNVQHLAKHLQMSKITIRNGLRVNEDVNAYVEILQTIVVKPPWIDSVANGGRPLYVFQQDPLPSHIALNIQNWMDGQEFSSSCHTKLLLAS
ncbi:hypothetical protein ACTXT7_012275 [Hymenolepis weldensis]